MITIGSRIRRALPRIQPYVEGVLGVKLGQIDVLPVANSYVRDILRADASLFSRRPFIKAVGVSLAYLLGLTEEMQMETSAMAEYSTIGYSRNPIINLVTFRKEALDHLVAHELAHQAHFRILGLETDNYRAAIDKIPKWIVEGFAEYISRSIIKMLYGNSGERRLIFNHKYVEERKKFMEALEERKVSDTQGLIEFIKEHGN